MLRRRAVVNLTGGTAVSGVLLARRGPLLILAEATVHEPGRDPAPADGQVVVPAERVAFIQVVTG